MFRFCACCPSPCRRAIPADAPEQLESDTPSALSMITLAVIDGQLDFDMPVRRALGRTALARHCTPACPYGYDIAGSVEAFVAEREQQR
jgi:hypothetical protein